MDKAPDLMAAVRAKDARAVRRLLDEEPGLASARGVGGESAVLAAIYAGADEIARLLVERGAALDVFSAAAAGNLPALERRLGEDAREATAFAADGWTPLHLAAFFGHAAAVDLLLARGADPRALSRNPTANTALHAAAVRGHRDVVERLLAGGSEIDGRAGGGWTALQLAAGSGHEGVAERLLAHGADPAAREDLGRTALEIAEATHHPKVAAILRRHAGR